MPNKERKLKNCKKKNQPQEQRHLDICLTGTASPAISTQVDFEAIVVYCFMVFKKFIMAIEDIKKNQSKGLLNECYKRRISFWNLRLAISIQSSGSINVENTEKSRHSRPFGSGGIQCRLPEPPLFLCPVGPSETTIKRQPVIV